MIGSVVLRVEVYAGPTVGQVFRDLVAVADKLQMPVICNVPTPGNAATQSMAYPEDDPVDIERSYWFRHKSDFPLLTAKDGQSCPLSNEDLGMAPRRYEKLF